MMPHYRSEYRARAREAIAAVPSFAGVTVLRVWNGTIDFVTLPVVGVVTPQERVEEPRPASATRRTVLQVAVRRAGGDDVEDRLDQDSETIEALILSTFAPLNGQPILEETSVITKAEGHTNVATLVMSFRLTSFRAPRRIP